MITAEEMEREIKDLIAECKNQAYIDYPVNEKKRKYHDDLLNAILSRLRLLELAQKSKETEYEAVMFDGQSQIDDAVEAHQAWTAEYKKQRQVGT